MIRYVLVIAVATASTAWYCRRGEPAKAESRPTTWDFARSRSTASIDWPEDRALTSADHWDGHRNELTIKPPSGRELTFRDVDFAIDREKGKVAFIRLSMDGLSHERMLAESRRLCGAWHTPEMSQRVAEVFPHAKPARTAPATFISQGRGSLIRISHDGPAETPWRVEVDLTFKN